MSTIVYNVYSVEAPGTRLDNHIHNVIAYSTHRLMAICLHSRDIVVTTGTPQAPTSLARLSNATPRKRHNIKYIYIIQI